MNTNVIFTLFLIMIALVGASVVSAADADDIGTFEIEDVEIDEIDVDDAVDNEAAQIDVEENASSQVDVEDNQTVEEEVNATIEEATEEHSYNYEQIELYFDPNYKQHNELDIMNIVPIFNEVRDMYGSGHSTKEIGAELNMTSDEVQTLVDKYIYPPIESDSLADSIYKLYGTKTLSEMAQDLGVTQDKISQKVGLLKCGYYGDKYKRLLLHRDMFLLNSELNDFIIGEVTL